MEHFYEATLIDTIDGIQCKVYANSHPEGMVIVKPKYIPANLIEFTGLKKRFLFETAMNRFNLFKSKEIVKDNLDKLKVSYPYFFYDCEKHKNWFLVVPKEKIKTYHHPQKGLQQLMSIPLDHLDDYLKATKEFIELLIQSGISVNDLGISHSTLLGNYTPGKSDIDILIFGKENGWKVLQYMETVQHPDLKWKTAEDWATYYRKRIVSQQFNEEEYVFNMLRKRDDGYFRGNVFSLFVVENPEECWYDWDAQREPLGTVKIEGTVTDNYHCTVRPGYYEIENTTVLEGYENVPIKRIVTWARPFSLQAQNGEKVEACGLLERVKPVAGEEYYQIVIGYFDTYTNERGEQEYLKTLRG
ncbi:MAG: hypothetical protein KKH52_01495 [Nanoarchaeota archaeon]|nr:hypothetical protein [Nanoarchaeota archaeon]